MNRTLVAGLLVVGTLALAASAAPALTSVRLLDSPTRTAIDQKLQPPGAGHWLGTDELGRDVLSRVLHGARPSLAVAVIATLVALLLGLPSGALAGVRGGIWDLILTRLMELTASLPSLPLILLVLSLSLGGPGGGGLASLLLLAVTIGVTRWAGIARYVRGGIWKTQVEDYVAGSRALGSGRGRLLFRHLLPSAVNPALVSAAFGAGSAVLLESALSFLGLGTQPPLPSWGRMVAVAAQEPGAWWLLAVPGAAIAALVMGFNLLAEGIRLHGAPRRGAATAGPFAVAGRGGGQDGLRLPERYPRRSTETNR